MNINFGILRKATCFLLVAAFVHIGDAAAAPVINSVLTSYSSTGVPTAITVFGTGLCSTATCTTTSRPSVTLGGAALSPVSGSATGITAPLGVIADGAYMLTVKLGSSSATFALSVQSKTTGGTGTGATVTVNSTTTGLPGTLAAVTNSGTATAAALNFTIPRGDTGPQGIQGPTGAAGPAGPQGSAGPSGPQGPAGASGPAGPQGVAGPAGVAGVNGTTGPQGPKGDTGAGFSFQGAWATGATYNLRDVVTANGSSYVALGTSTGINPATDTSGTWAMLAAKGADGAAGSVGSIGPMGPQGPIGPTGAIGPQGVAGATGPAGADGAVGPKGDTGNTGPMGPVGLQGPKGDKGDTGPQGEAGTFPSATVVGAMLYWNGATWTEISPPPANSSVTLRFCATDIRWAAYCPGPITAGTTTRDCADCPTLMSVPGGTFLMGGSDPDALANELPVHSVTVPSFLIGQTEVTQGEWVAVMGSNPSYFRNCGPTCPVEQVSWNDVQAFLVLLSAKTGKTYRLPTEAEWEYSARGGNTGVWSFGNDPSQLVNYAWFATNGGGITHQVGTRAPNGFGLYDMQGNVWEYVQDGNHPNYIGAPTDGSEWTAGADLTKRMSRGGSISGFDGPTVLRPALRGFGPTTVKDYNNVGFRVARSF